MSRWFVLAAVLVACGGGASEEPAVSAPVSAPAPSNVSSLTFHFRPSLSADPVAGSLRSKLEGQLVSAGYKLVEGTADVELALEVRSQLVPSMFQVSLNGQPSGKTHVVATVALYGSGALLDRVQADWTGDAGTVDDGAVATLVNGIGHSNGVGRLSAQIEQRHQAEAQAAEDATRRAEEKKKLAELAEQKRQRGQEDAAWAMTHPERCANPAAPTACDRVRAFLAQYPEGAHAEEAKALLETVRPKLEQIEKDDAAWSSSESDACSRIQTREACAKVDVYVAKYPSGRHLLEAQELMRGVK